MKLREIKRTFIISLFKLLDKLDFRTVGFGCFLVLCFISFILINGFVWYLISVMVTRQSVPGWGVTA